MIVVRGLRNFTEKYTLHWFPPRPVCIVGGNNAATRRNAVRVVLWGAVYTFFDFRILFPVVCNCEGRLPTYTSLCVGWHPRLKNGLVYERFRSYGRISHVPVVVVQCIQRTLPLRGESAFLR